MKDIDNKIKSKARDLMELVKLETDFIKLSVRDDFLTSKESWVYRLWGHNVVEYNVKEECLYISLCYHDTLTTRNRLKAICSLFDISIVRKEEYTWMYYNETTYRMSPDTRYKINLQTKEVSSEEIPFYY